MTSSQAAHMLGAFTLFSTGVLLSGWLFWRLQPLFWFGYALTLVATCYFVLNGVAEQVAYGIWPTIEPAKRIAMERQMASHFDSILGLMLVVPLYVSAVLFAWWRSKTFPLAIVALMGALLVLFQMSPLPAKLARAVLSDKVVDELTRQYVEQLERR